MQIGGIASLRQFPNQRKNKFRSLFDKIAPKLRRVLRTPASAYHFVDLLASSFALERRVTEGDLLIVKPSQKTERAEPVLEDQDDPVEPPV
jgi:hypothetical protein